jgi:putative ABC transport system permease protein
MFSYYILSAIRNFRQDMAFFLLIVATIGLGIGATMTAATVIHVMSGDPIPERSASLFVPHLDPLPLRYHQYPGAPDPSDYLTWPDAMAIVRADVGLHQAAMAGGSTFMRPVGGQAGRPSSVNGRLTTFDFFEMFGVPFEHGSGWTAVDDESRSRVIVLTTAMAVKLFGNTNCIGTSVRLADDDFRIIGVVPNWHPSPLFYGDPAAKSFDAADQFFIPLTTAIDTGITVNGNTTVWGDSSNMKAMLTSPTTTWLQVWVQLANTQQQIAFKTFLTNYVAQQRDLGRYERPVSEVHVFRLMDYMRHLGLVPYDVLLQFWVSVGFLLICVTNIIGLLLSKFMSRRGEVSIRRAMGASKVDIFFQFGVESALIGVLGGVLGLFIAQFGLYLVRSRPDDYAHLAHMDTAMLALTFALAITATFVAGMLPAWRACHIQPSLQMKSH